jgi:hypothetical protein
MALSDRFIIKDIGEDLMCYDMDTDEVHVLNSTARTVHRLLNEGRAEEEIVVFLMAQPHAPGKEEVAADVRACMEDLQKKGLVSGQ